MARPYCELYINDKKVYFKEPPEIFVTYAHTDLHNPTVVKNSYTKTITVEGTPENNKIFNDFYDMHRINDGELFNASRKENFTLYRNGEPMETGYVKLDKVEKNNGKISYSITLYGGLGQFLYNLQYNDKGEQMKLSDLEYSTDFTFEVNKNTVRDAWDHIMTNKQVENGELYDIINFAPSYNGIPEDFSADKVAIDMNSLSWNEQFKKQIITSKDGYTTVDGWLLGELEKEYDEYQMYDIRSYLQRPVIRFKEIFNACCNPENNGGYEVDLDEEFFTEANPYYENAWMTLPLLSNTDEEETPVSFSMSGDKILVNGAKDNTKLSFSIPFTMITTVPNYEAHSTANKLYTGVQITLNPSRNTIKQGKVEGYNATRYAQLVIYDANDRPVGGSTILSFHTDILQASEFEYDPEFNTTIVPVLGQYNNVGESQRYDNAKDFVFNNSYYFLDVKNFVWQDGCYMKLVVKTSERRKYNDAGEVVGPNYLYKNNMYYSGEDTVPTVFWEGNIGSLNVNVTSKLNNLKRIVNKKQLLNSEQTPCDYFLSYLKMFNLHIWKDMYDNIIYVRQRKNFFTGEVKDIEDFVDRGNTISIKPLTFENKWLNFKTEGETDDKLQKDYKNEYGVEYGIQKVDTNYAFDSSSKDVLENFAFKGCIMNRNKSKYYVNLREQTEDGGIYWPPFMLDGCQTLLFNSEGDTTEGSYLSSKTSIVSNGWWKERYYDFIPRPNFTDKDNKGVDGANVLLFYNGYGSLTDSQNRPITMYLTDDIPQFETLNEDEPCWIWSTGALYARGLNEIPCFSRYLTNDNGWITHSWDFGTPKALYVPDYNIDQNSSLYTQYWQPYIRDQYDANTRIVECYVLLRERVVGDWLQNFYYWDGRYWVLNKITDYNPVSNGTTKCEFISINNMNNYLQ